MIIIVIEEEEEEEEEEEKEEEEKEEEQILWGKILTLKKFSFTLPEDKPRFLWRPASILVILPTNPYRIPDTLLNILLNY
jgi:hypothetical protein